jgi:ribosomal protein S1
VAGTVKAINEKVGLFIDVGAEKEALLRIRSLGADKTTADYKVGDELTDLIITRVDPRQNQLEVNIIGVEAVPDDTKQLSDLTVGTEVDGEVVRIMEFGVFINIGATRDALWATQQLPKPRTEFKAGDKVTGLKIIECDVEKSRLSVSDRPTAADYEVGQEVTGKVMKIMAFGLFVDIGASTEALIPASRLEKDSPTEYTVGEVLPGLKIGVLDVATNKISVNQLEGGKALKSGRISIDDLKVGQQIKGVVRTAKEYGVFVDIGLGRKDALLPSGSLNDDVKPESFQPNQEIEVYVAMIDAGQERITLSQKEPPEGGFTQTAAARYTGKVPYGMRVPNLMDWKKQIGEMFIDEEPINWREWEKKYPGMIVHAKKEMELYIFANAFQFQGIENCTTAQVCWLPIPVHLRKDDAGPPEIPPEDFEDHQMGYEYGIKPEIHVKFRQPPFNDPNWMWVGGLY